MDWIPIENSADFSALLNKRIATHLRFRAEIDDGTAKLGMPTGRTGALPPMALRQEALRRELFIRRDICNHLAAAGKAHEEHSVAYAMINEELDNTNGHTSARGGIGYRSCT